MATLFHKEDRLLRLYVGHGYSKSSTLNCAYQLPKFSSPDGSMSRVLLILAPVTLSVEFAEVSCNFPKEIHSSKGGYNSFTNRTETATSMVNQRLAMGWITAHKYDDILFLFLEQTFMVLCPSFFHCYVNLYPFSSLYSAFFAFPATLIFTTEIWKRKRE